MSESSVLQNLIAEHSFRAIGPQDTEQIKQESLQRKSQAKSRQNDCEHNLVYQFESLTKDNNEPQRQNLPRRALSDDSPKIGRSQAILKSSSRSAELGAPHFSQYNANSVDKGVAVPQLLQPAISQTSGLISRLRQEFLVKPSSNVGRMANISMHPTETKQGSPEDGITTTTFAVGSVFCQGNYTSPSTSRQHGHPKSNSAGEEFLYTDRKAKLTNNKTHKRHIRGKGASVARSRSLHYNEEHSPQRTVNRRPATDLGLGMDPFLGTKSETNGSTRKKSDASTLSGGSDLKTSSISQSSSSAENHFQISTNEGGIQAAVALHADNAPIVAGVKATQYPHLFANNPNLSSMVVTPNGTGGLPQTSLTAGPHGPFYATVPTNAVAQHQMSHKQSPPPPPPQHQDQSTTSPPHRGPPPPYPQGVPNMEDLNQPQRPNSLPLSGHVSRKKMEYGNGIQVTQGSVTSPVLSSNVHAMNFSSYAMSAGTPVHGTFFSPPQETATTTAGGSNNSVTRAYPVSSQQQTNQSPFTRNGSDGLSGSGFHRAQSVETQPYGNTNTSTSSTFMGTPVLYQQQPQQRYDTVPPMRSAHQQHTTQKQPTSPSYAQHFIQHQSAAVASGMEFVSATGSNILSNTSSNGYSLGKSDSVNSNASTSSGGSRIARRAKRNSKNFSNTSGSSSSTGNSRPNSSADFLERVMNENDMLRSQLQTSNQKLKKYQNVEKDLLRVTEEYKTLHSSVTKSEEMERILRNQLEATSRRVQQENGILRERIKTLTELVETLQSSNKDVLTTSTSDIMMYKVKVQELQTKERLLQQQLDESNETISDQQADISLLSRSLEKTQETIADLKGKLLDKQKIDQYTEELSPILDVLSTTVRARLEVENELQELLKLNQRRSTSSNDEGISEMESVELANSSQSECSTTQQNEPPTRDEQLIRTHGQMLKWQHMYIELVLLREMSATNSDSCGQTVTGTTAQHHTMPLFNLLSCHRHAASDPSFNKNNPLWLPTWDLTTVNSHFGREIAKMQRPNSSGEQKRSSPRRRRRESPPSAETPDHAAPTDISRYRTKSQSKSIENFETDLVNASGAEPQEKTESDADDVSKVETDPCANTDAPTPPTDTTTSQSAEFDSPSEGYHSQQSSGSPTPSSERSSVHFPDGDSRVTAALDSVQDTQSSNACTPHSSTIARQSTANSGLYLLGSSDGTGKTVLTKVVDV